MNGSHRVHVHEDHTPAVCELCGGTEADLYILYLKGRNYPPPPSQFRLRTPISKEGRQGRNLAGKQIFIFVLFDPYILFQHVNGERIGWFGVMLVVRRYM